MVSTSKLIFNTILTIQPLGGKVTIVVRSLDMYKKKISKINKKSSILILGSTGMIGSRLLKKLQDENYANLLHPTRKELDLNIQSDVNKYFKLHKPDIVFHLAAIVGGIKANNDFPAKFIYENTIMQSNIFNASHENNVKQIIFPGSACTYPKFAKQPINEDSFLDGKIEPTNIAYAAAKINGIITAQSFAKQYDMDIVVPMPTNTYGIGDHFDPEKSHVIPALMKRFHDAKKQNLESIKIWGSGNALREFIYVDDFVSGLLFLAENYNSSEIINLSTMDEISIKDLANKIANVVGYKGKIMFDTSKPDGAPRKCLDNKKITDLGWKPTTSLDQGLQLTYDFYFS